MNVFPSLHRSRCLLAVWITFLLCLPLLSSGPSAQAAPPSVRLSGHIPAALAHARAMGRVPSGEPLALALTLPVRDPAGLQTLLDRVYTPGDPLYHQYLTPEEFTQRFGPTQQSYDAVIAFALARGLTVTRAHPNRLLVEVSGPAATVESAFGVHLGRYQDANGRVFHAPDNNPAIPASLVGHLSGVIGLDNAVLLRPHHHHALTALHSTLRSALAPAALTAGIGTDPNDGGLTPSDIKAAYNLSKVSLNGAGRTLALYELDGYDPNDIATYQKTFGLRSVPLQNILVGQADGMIHSIDGGGEVTLDIELMAALAQGATKILVYEGKNGTTDQLTMYNQIANDDLAKEISTSWGLEENETGKAFTDAENVIFQQMAAQGQSIYAAAGDSGAYDNGANLSVDDPASQPYVVGVGGTTLSVVAPGGAYQSESAWADPTDTSRTSFGLGGGGGISTLWPLPNYQTGVGQSRTQRNVPDVCLDADGRTGYSIYYSGTGGWNEYYGTSCAAPLWAAFTALVNQQRTAYSQPPLGFANPLIYQIGKSAKYASAFHDVALGTNLFYPALLGYDNATGWGSFNGAGLLPLFAPPPVNAVGVASVTLTPNPVVGGLSVKGTVTLVNPAPTGGATVTLATTDNVTAPVPATVAFTAGQTSADFTFTTATVTTKTSVAVTATYQGGEQTAVLTVQPPVGVVTPHSLSVVPSSVNGGDSSTATLTLTGPAPVGGVNVTLSSSSAAAQIPASVFIPQGAVSTTFTVTTSQVPKLTVATLTATANGGTTTADLTVLTPELGRLVLNPAQLPGGQTSTGTLNLTSPAPTGGAVVALSSDNPAAVVAATVTIPAGEQTTTFTITTSAVPTTVTATIKATYADLDQTAKLTIQSARIVSVSVAPTSVTGGSTSTGTVTLDSPVAVPTGLAVTLSSSSAAGAVSATVTVPQGAATATFPITTTVVPGPISDTITATLDSRDKTTVLTIQPIQVINLTLTPSQVITGAPSQGIVTVNAPAPAGGLAVALSSLGAAEAFPASALVPAGATSVTFPIATPAPGIATLSAIVGGQTRTATLTVTVAPGTSYPAGLSMISSPYDYSGQPLSAVFGSTSAKLAVWQPGAGIYAYTPNAPADTLRLGQGYWVRLTKAVTLATAGTPADPKTDFPITLAAGWNQIGDPFLVPITLGNLHVSSGGAPATFAQAAAGTPLLVSNLVYSYSQSAASGKGAYLLTRSDGSLQPGMGYWIYAYQPVTLIIPHPGQ